MEVQRITQILWLCEFFGRMRRTCRKIFALLEKIARRLFSHPRPIHWALPPRLVVTRPLPAAAGIEDAPFKVRPLPIRVLAPPPASHLVVRDGPGGRPKAIQNGVCLAGARPGYCFA